MSIILSNLQYILIAWSVFVMCVLANVISKTFFNTHNSGQKFSYQKLWDGIKKMISLGVSSALLAIVASALPHMPFITDLVIDEHQETISIVLIYSMYAYLIVRYFIEAHKTNMDIAKNRNLVDEISSSGDSIE